MSILKRWPKRREFLAYYMLLVYSSRVGLKEINAGEAIDVLSTLTGSKKLARKLLRILVRQGYLERVRPLTYKVKELDSILNEALGYYLAGRLKRRGIDASYTPDNNTLAIYDREKCESIAKIIRLLGYNIRC